MLKAVATSNTANRASWNQSTPKYHRYNGTAVSVRTNVPIKNELVVQLMRPIGIRKIKVGILRSITRTDPEDRSRWSQKRDYLRTVSLCLNLEKLPSYRAVPGNRVSNHQ